MTEALPICFRCDSDHDNPGRLYCPRCATDQEIVAALSRLPFRSDPQWPLLPQSDRALLDALRYTDNITDRDVARLRAMVARLEGQR